VIDDLLVKPDLAFVSLLEQLVVLVKLVNTQDYVLLVEAILGIVIYHREFVEQSSDYIRKST
jgi:hypothetical protein